MAQRRGWRHDATNGRLAAEYDGTEVFDFDANDMAIATALVVTGAITASAGLAGTGALSATTTVTAGTDLRATAGNLRLGAIETFATTEPTSAVVMKAGTAPAGAITTSGGLFSTTTVVQKIIAAGTVSNVETAVLIGLGVVGSAFSFAAAHGLIGASTALA